MSRHLSKRPKTGLAARDRNPQRTAEALLKKAADELAVEVYFTMVQAAFIFGAPLLSVMKVGDLWPLVEAALNPEMKGKRAAIIKALQTEYPDVVAGYSVAKNTPVWRTKQLGDFMAAYAKGCSRVPAPETTEEAIGSAFAGYCVAANDAATSAGIDMSGAPELHKLGAEVTEFAQPRLSLRQLTALAERLSKETYMAEQMKRVGEMKTYVLLSLT